MGTVLFSHTNLVDGDGVTLTESSEVSTLPAENVLTDIIAEIWRTQSYSFNILIDFGADVDVDVIAWAMPNDANLMASTDKVSYYIDADGGTPGTGAVYKSENNNCGMVARFGYSFHQTGATKTGRYLKIIWVATSLTSLNYADIGRIWVGESWQPTINYEYGAERSIVDGTTPLKIGETSLVQYRGTPGSKARSFSLPFNHLSDSDQETIEDMIFDVGTEKQILLCLDPDSPGRTTFLGRFVQPPVSVARYFDGHSLTTQFRESR